MAEQESVDDRTEGSNKQAAAAADQSRVHEPKTGAEVRTDTGTETGTSAEAAAEAGVDARAEMGTGSETPSMTTDEAGRG